MVIKWGPVIKIHEGKYGLKGKTKKVVHADIIKNTYIYIKQIKQIS